MRARFFVLLFTFAAPIALIWMSPIAPVSTTAFAQGQGQGNQPAAQAQGQPTTVQGAGAALGRMNSPTFAGPPTGMQTLPIDLFLSKNFYRDQKLWSDQRYFRCNTPRQLTDIWTSHRIGEKPPTSAFWGD